MGPLSLIFLMGKPWFSTHHLYRTQGRAVVVRAGCGQAVHAEPYMFASNEQGAVACVRPACWAHAQGSLALRRPAASHLMSSAMKHTTAVPAPTLPTAAATISSFSCARHVARHSSALGDRGEG